MKLIRKWQKEVECRNCGSLLLIKEQDVKVWKRSIGDLIHIYATCALCKYEVVLYADSLPKLLYDKCYKEYGRLLNNNFEYTLEFGYIPRFELEKGEADKKELEKEIK
jgi:hypothetical protein